MSTQISISEVWGGSRWELFFKNPCRTMRTFRYVWLTINIPVFTKCTVLSCKSITITCRYPRQCITYSATPKPPLLPKYPSCHTFFKQGPTLTVVQTENIIRYKKKRKQRKIKWRMRKMWEEVLWQKMIMMMWHCLICLKNVWFLSRMYLCWWTF